MARLETLVEQIADQVLRREIESALAASKRRQHFGLVFEEHIPETTALFGLPIQPGSLVQRRDESASTTLFHVKAVLPDGNAVIEPTAGGDAETVAMRNLLTVKRFGDPMYPTLTPLGSVRQGGEAAPHHVVINSENSHALQLLVYLFEGEVDCIYIDPPYNSGARDWKYNNNYVDANDVWSHSKWLSFMEKRLRIARRLLKKDGVLIVTIDENEVHHLGMLLEQMFSEYDRYMLTIVINPKGTGKVNFGRVDEQVFYIVPRLGGDVITGEPIANTHTASASKAEVGFSDAASAPALLFAAVDSDRDPVTSEDEMPADEDDDEMIDDPGDETEEDMEDVAVTFDPRHWERQHARRRGAESSYRGDRPNQFYPIYINEAERSVVRIGASISGAENPDFTIIDGLRPIWPIDARGDHRLWRFIPASMQRELDAGKLILGSYNRRNDSWTLNILRPRKTRKKIKTVWPYDSRYDAGTHGTELVRKLLGRPKLFPFPKSVYAVRDCLAAVVRDRPNALIIDFFAGSGTTFHATCLLNALDNGHRRSIMVTNNEVASKLVRQLNRQGLFQGDPGYEANGIFELVTRPRCEAVVTGRRPDGAPVEGDDATGRPLARGFQENVSFYRLDYLDPEEVDLGLQYNAIVPSLWLAAGGIGSYDTADDFATGFSMPAGSTYGVLFKESRFHQFRQALAHRPEVTHIWIVTDSEEAYAEMLSALPMSLSVSMLYRDYLRNFRINTDRTV